MFRKFNVFVISFFAVATIKYNIGLTIFLPILIFYLVKDPKNLYVIVPSGFISLFLFEPNALVAYGLMTIMVVLFLFIMRNSSQNIYIYLFFPLVITLTHFMIYKKIDNLLLFVILNIVSLLVYIYLEFNLVQSLKKDSLFYNNSYLEMVLISIGVLGAVKINVSSINLGLITSFYGMYLAKSTKDVFAMLYGL